MHGHSGVILHVEDDADFRDSLAMLFKLSGYEPHSAGTPAAALECARQLRDRLDVLIVDFHLEAYGSDGRSGTDVAETICRMLGRAVPTILLTGDLANADVPLLSGAPMWLLRKPPQPARLMAALPSLVSLHRALRDYGEADGVVASAR